MLSNSPALRIRTNQQQHGLLETENCEPIDLFPLFSACSKVNNLLELFVCFLLIFMCICGSDVKIPSALFGIDFTMEFFVLRPVIQSGRRSDSVAVRVGRPAVRFEVSISFRFKLLSP